ncbi:MAG TPA: cysteine peptidase family C39 domain-containing protein [Planctomycetota bacterium]|nr:cysteine peptidase family C39 domain-containing protein [Planctomycetota bacterium]
MPHRFQEARRALLMAAALAALALAGCSTYLGGSRPIDPSELAAPGWIAVPNVIYIAQQEEKDCGAAALAMVLVHWKLALGIEEVRAACPPDPKRGTEAGALRDFARTKGLRAFLFEGDYRVFEKELARGRPVLVGMFKRTLGGLATHFEVVVGYHPERGLVMTLDPALGPRVNEKTGFSQEWELAKCLTLVVFLVNDK